MPVTDGGKEIIRVPYIHYPVRFQENQGQEQVRAFFDSGREVNAMSPAYAEK